MTIETKVKSAEFVANTEDGVSELDKLLQAAKDAEGASENPQVDDEEDLELEEADFPTFDKMKRMASDYMKQSGENAGDISEGDEEELPELEGDEEVPADDEFSDKEIPSEDNDMPLERKHMMNEADEEAEEEEEVPAEDSDEPSEAPVESDEEEEAPVEGEDDFSDEPVSNKEVDTILFDTETEEEADEPAAESKKKDEESESEEEEEEDEKAEHLDDEKLEEHVSAMFKGIDASPEFLANAKTIFEAAVKAEVNAMLKDKRVAIKEAMNAKINEKVTKIKKLHEKALDKYASYVAKEFIAENKTNLKSSIQAQLNESFMSGLRALFEKHYVAIPENRKGVLSKMSSKVNKLTEANEKATKKMSKLNEALNAMKRERIVEAACEGLTMLQGEKIRKLLENVDYKGEVDFINKAKVIRESYNSGAQTDKSAKKPLNENKHETDPMERYLEAVSRNAKY